MKKSLVRWFVVGMPDDDVKEIVEELIRTNMPGWVLVPPGYHKHKNPSKKEAKDE